MPMQFRVELHHSVPLSLCAASAQQCNMAVLTSSHGTSMFSHVTGNTGPAAVQPVKKRAKI